jgi:hypothetical protein
MSPYAAHHKKEKERERYAQRTERKKQTVREYHKRYYEKNLKGKPKKPPTPEQIEHRKAYSKEYYRRPDVQQKIKERQQTTAYQEYHKAYQNSARVRKISAERERQRRYCFPIGLFDKLMKIQNYSCAVCERPFASMKSKNIHADHCHDAKKPRGILCQECNLAEGAIKKIGLSPYEFAVSLEHYLLSPPASQLT